jgi:hypothetical protein
LETASVDDVRKGSAVEGAGRVLVEASIANEAWAVEAL